MAALLHNIGWHLRHIADFRGREGRDEFWTYAFIILGICFVATFAIVVPLMEESMRRMQEFANAHPDQATVTSGPGQYSITIKGSHPELMPDFKPVIGGMTVLAVVAVLLLASAVARRLHDRGMRGWWGLLPLPFLTYSFAEMAQFFADAGHNMSLFFSVFVSNFLYLAALGLLAFLLAGATEPRKNRFGTPPQGR